MENWNLSVSSDVTVAKIDLVAQWRAALETLQNAELALKEWRLQHPRPAEDDADNDDWPEGQHYNGPSRYDLWWQASEPLLTPLFEAETTLEELPAPDLQAVIVKLDILRSHLDDIECDDDVERRIDLIARDLHRLAGQA